MITNIIELLNSKGIVANQKYIANQGKELKSQTVITLDSIVSKNRLIATHSFNIQFYYLNDNEVNDLFNILMCDVVKLSKVGNPNLEVVKDSKQAPSNIQTATYKYRIDVIA